jgi:hypothetical protein
VQTYTRVLGCVIAAGLGLASQPTFASSTESSELSALRSEIEAMKQHYEERLRALEERLEAAELRASGGAAENAGRPYAGESELPSVAANTAAGTPAPVDTALPEPATEPTNAFARLARAFNPSIGVILQGRATYFSDGGGGARGIPGYPLGGETDRGPEGLSLGESEVVFSANIDDKFYGFFDVSFDQDDIGVEEAYFSTLSMPFGLGVKGGKFLSSIGYHNDRHPHSWDFVDAPLVYDAMLDGALSDAGLQISWIAPTDQYLELGAEIFRGDAYPAAGAENNGFGTTSVFAKFAGDLDESNSWKAGVSYLRAESNGRESEFGSMGTFSFDGSSDLVVADFVWKWAPLGNFRERNFTFQAEYMHRHESGPLASAASAGRYRSDQDGFYVQGVYQFMPRWRVGARYGELWSDDRVNGSLSGTLGQDGSSPRRVSAMVDFSNSEFSRLRLQYSFASGGLGDDSLVYLQYIMSIGSHGAHTF